MIEELVTFVRCLRAPQSWWVEPAAGGWWRWTIRDRWGRVLQRSDGEWARRGEAILAVEMLRDGIARAPIVVDYG